MNVSTTALARIAPLALSALFAATAAQAGPTWGFGDTTAPAPCAAGAGGTGYGNSFNCSATGTTTMVNVTAFSDTTSGAKFATANVGTNDPSGFGVKNQIETLTVNSPNHAMDNIGQTDMLLLTFSGAVALNQVTIGWHGTNDSDITVLRYTGSSAPSIVGQTAGTLIGSGWSLVGSYGNLSDGAAQNINGTNLSSSWWLITAYNSTFGGSGFTAGDDAVKLLSVAGTVTAPPRPGAVPEPASLALAGVALVALAGVRRRRAKADPAQV